MTDLISTSVQSQPFAIRQALANSNNVQQQRRNGASNVQSQQIEQQVSAQTQNAILGTQQALNSQNRAIAQRVDSQLLTTSLTQRENVNASLPILRQGLNTNVQNDSDTNNSTRFRDTINSQVDNGTNLGSLERINSTSELNVDELSAYAGRVKNVQLQSEQQTQKISSTPTASQATPDANSITFERSQAFENASVQLSDVLNNNLIVAAGSRNSIQPTLIAQELSPASQFRPVGPNGPEFFRSARLAIASRQAIQNNLSIEQSPQLEITPSTNVAGNEQLPNQATSSNVTIAQQGVSTDQLNVLDVAAINRDPVLADSGSRSFSNDVGTTGTRQITGQDILLARLVDRFA